MRRQNAASVLKPQTPAIHLSPFIWSRARLEQHGRNRCGDGAAKPLLGGLEQRPRPGCCRLPGLISEMDHTPMTSRVCSVLPGAAPPGARCAHCAELPEARVPPRPTRCRFPPTGRSLLPCVVLGCCRLTPGSQHVRHRWALRDCSRM